MTYPTTITAAPGLPFIDTERQFDAPAEAVFRAHTDADLYAQWLGPRTMRLDTLVRNASTGGRWSYSFRGPGDMEFSFFGVFHSVEPNTLLVHTVEFNLAPGEVGLSSTTFHQEDGGRTGISVHDVYPSVEARDAALASGMEHGVLEGYERLDELLAR